MLQDFPQLQCGGDDDVHLFVCMLQDLLQCGGDDDVHLFVCVLQDLLQLQYDGVAVMKMFNRAKVNVNLLIFLLNRKFYGKQLGK